MTGTLNRTQIIGYLGKNPEIFVADSGREIARLSLATHDRYKDKDGNSQKQTEWHRAVVFAEGLVAKVIKPFLKQGSKILLEGSNRTRKYTDKDGVERYSTEIVAQSITLLDGKESGK